MSKDQKNPLAFPYCGVGDDLNFSRGMTLRDYFAAKAMQAQLSAMLTLDPRETKNAMDKAGINSAMGLFAKNSYDQADAMLKAREV